MKSVRVCEAPLHEEGSSPDAGEVFDGPCRESVREAADGSVPGIQQACLPREHLSAGDDSDEVRALGLRPGSCDHRNVGLDAVELEQRAPELAGGVSGVELALDGDAAVDDVQPAREAEHR